MLRARSNEKFGTFLLFRKLHADALSELWRGVRLPGGEPVALRRFVGGDLESLRASAESARRIVPHLTGTTIVRNQEIGVIDSTPFIAFSYSGGRSLRHIVEKARSAKPSNPIPLDQVLTIAEKITQSLVTLHHLKLQGRRLTHGALLPDMVWVTDEGEIRVCGQEMAEAILRSRNHPGVTPLVGPYLAPESSADEKQPPPADMFSLGAILFLLLTGQSPPILTSPVETDKVLDEARLHASGKPIPPELRTLLDRTFAWDPGQRFKAPSEAHRSISALLEGEQYTATTFNLAFYLHTLLSDELQRESAEKEKESEAVQRLRPVIPDAGANAVATASTAGDEVAAGSRRKRLMILAGIILAIVLAAGAAAAFFGVWALPSSH